MRPFYIMNKDEPLYRVQVDKLNVKLTSYNTNPIYKQFPTSTPTANDVLDWLEDRCFPKERANRDEVLENMGLTVYDPLSIISVTHGLVWDDYIWIKWEGEDIDYDSIKIRD